jgi:hypothetical protein
MADLPRALEVAAATAAAEGVDADGNEEKAWPADESD